jgi:hypothetical protein
MHPLVVKEPSHMAQALPKCSAHMAHALPKCSAVGVHRSNKSLNMQSLLVGHACQTLKSRTTPSIANSPLACQRTASQ